MTNFNHAMRNTTSLPRWNRYVAYINVDLFAHACPYVVVLSLHSHFSMLKLISLYINSVFFNVYQMRKRPQVNSFPLCALGIMPRKAVDLERVILVIFSTTFYQIFAKNVQMEEKVKADDNWLPMTGFSWNVLHWSKLPRCIILSDKIFCMTIALSTLCVRFVW